MKLTDIKELKLFCESLHSNPDWKEVLDFVKRGDDDFEVNNVRFINANHIQEALEDYIASDTYTLGCFNASAIADATGWPIELIKAAQIGDQYEAIGDAMTGEHIAALAHIYSSTDGYGHAFNSYDFSEEELHINDEIYHVFDNRG